MSGLKASTNYFKKTTKKQLKTTKRKHSPYSNAQTHPLQMPMPLSANYLEQFIKSCFTQSFIAVFNNVRYGWPSRYGDQLKWPMKQASLS